MGVRNEYVYMRLDNPILSPLVHTILCLNVNFPFTTTLFVFRPFFSVVLLAWSALSCRADSYDFARASKGSSKLQPRVLQAAARQSGIAARGSDFLFAMTSYYAIFMSVLWRLLYVIKLIES